jgi:hypothetical protein
LLAENRHQRRDSVYVVRMIITLQGA